MEDLVNVIEVYLQKNHTEEWYVKLKDNKIIAFLSSKKRFEIIYDVTYADWYIDGKYLRLSMINEIYGIIKSYELIGFKLN